MKNNLEEKKYMTPDEIWNIFEKLSKSQGFYGRLIRNIEGSGKKDEILEELASHNFKTALDLILFIEE